MKYQYFLRMPRLNVDRTFAGVRDVVKFVNDTTGCDLLTVNMVYNLFNRPQKANKRLFSTIQIQRVPCT